MMVSKIARCCFNQPSPGVLIDLVVTLLGRTTMGANEKRWRLRQVRHRIHWKLPIKEVEKGKISGGCLEIMDGAGANAGAELVDQ